MNDNSVSSDSKDDILVDLTADIAAAYVSNNSIAVDDVKELITNIYSALNDVTLNGGIKENLQTPAVAISKSISQEHIICLEDGKKFKSLKRHLRTHYNLSPEEYREKWKLPVDYPMVAPNYAAARSKLAKNMGLGHKGRSKSDK